ncbi:MAG: gamma-glutamyltransferase [Flavobacteriaceae bacterium]|nr:gamma-glutamyltransferase [Flavobacteriaceae bacterium]|tara:strand:- start:3238 stop:4917 length:1680 start_codon:yes stop_codon:yes gene_type:complete
MYFKNISPLILLSVILFSCNNNNNENGYKNGVVVSAKIEASQAGLSILKLGGNAFDAMIATDLALSVVYPNAGNLGGGGFMVYRLSDNSIGSLDFREKSPSLSTKDMYLDENGNEINGLSINGALAIGIPGTVAGLFEVYNKFGSLPLETLFAPAIKLAEEGFHLTKRQANSLNSSKNLINSINDSLFLFNKNFKEGDLFVNKSLSKSLKLILKNGRNEFYEGSISKEIINYVNERNGILKKEDFENYTAKWRKPITFKYKDLNIISMGPPSSGGIVLGQIFKMIEPFKISQFNHNKTKYIQLLVEAERRAFADRSKYLGDPDFNHIPTDTLLSNIYLEDRMNNFSFESSTKSETISPGEINFRESEETTHYSIVDGFGNAVSVTTTLNGNYGSKIFPPKLGFFLNNEMDDFSIKPGSPNMFGLTGGEINSIEPNKRMLSSMTPTIVEKNNKLHLVLGSPGGPTIITSVLQTILNFEDFNFNINKAVNSPRFYHIWLPDLIHYEPNAIINKDKQLLIEKGYYFNDYPNSIGRVDAIYVNEDGIIFGAADKRGDDKSVGF